MEILQSQSVDRSFTFNVKNIDKNITSLFKGLHSFCLLAKKIPTSLLILERIVEFFQVIAVFIGSFEHHPFQNTKYSNELHKFTNCFLIFPLFENSPKGAMISTIMFFCWLSFMSCVFVSCLFTTSGIVKNFVQTTFLACYVMPSSWFLYLPALGSLLNITTCKYDQVTSSYVARFDPSIQCFSAAHLPFLGMGLYAIPFCIVNSYIVIVFTINLGVDFKDSMARSGVLSDVIMNTARTFALLTSSMLPMICKNQETRESLLAMAVLTLSFSIPFIHTIARRYYASWMHNFHLIAYSIIAYIVLQLFIDKMFSGYNCALLCGHAFQESY